MRISLPGLVYLVVGVFVAANKDYLESPNTFEEIVSALLGIVLWPLLLFGVDLHVG
jgi:hypothetical protein